MVTGGGLLRGRGLRTTEEGRVKGGGLRVKC